MPIQSLPVNCGVLFSWQYVDMTMMKCYNKREQRRHGNSKAMDVTKVRAVRGVTAQPP